MKYFDYGHSMFILSVILASFRPIFYKEYKDYFFITVFFSLLSMYIGGILYSYYNLKKDETIKDKIKYSLEPKNLIYSFVSEMRFILKQFAVINLPLTISIPMNNLWMLSSAYFGKVINNETPSIVQIISICVIILGSVILNLHKIFEKNSKQFDKKSYIKGITALLLSTFLGGYIFSIFKHISTETQDPGVTMSIESGGSLIIAALILLYDRLTSKIINIPSFKNSMIMFFSLTFLFNIDILLRFIGLSKIPQMDSLFLSQIGTIIPVLVGFYFYKEKMNLNKLLGMGVITFGSLLDSVVG